MFGKLFLKECQIHVKSLTYYICIACLAVFFFMQMGEGNFREAAMPKEGQEHYGMKASDDPKLIMQGALGELYGEYSENSYATYPVGFIKYVQLSKAEQETIAGILQDFTGKSIEELKEEEKSADNATTMDNGAVWMTPLKLTPRADLTYAEFETGMIKIDQILGGGSSYAKENLTASEPMTYEDAKQEYRNLMEKDHLTGGLARLFCDYLGIILGILPAFLAVTRELRDRRCQTQDLIFSRNTGSARIVLSRYLALVTVTMIPVLLLSCVTLVQCIAFAQGQAISLDYLAFVKYSVCWLMPTVMATTALGMFLTELTETALGVLVQAGWWFVSIFTGAMHMDGSNCGWNLIPRNNTYVNYEIYTENLPYLIQNRIFYTVLAMVLVIMAVFCYEAKRKGRLDIRGKIFANRKRKS